MSLAMMDLSRTSYKIMFYLIGTLRPGNYVIGFSQKEIATALHIKPPNVCRAFKELFEKQVLLRDARNGCVYINANIAFFGSPKSANDELLSHMNNANVPTADFPAAVNIRAKGGAG